MGTKQCLERRLTHHVVNMVDRLHYVFGRLGWLPYRLHFHSSEVGQTAVEDVCRNTDP